MSKSVGDRGEAVVKQKLQDQGWQIIAANWHCRWGELDIVATREQCLVFVEVKTRSKGSWDEAGALAITPSKQAKIIKSAQEFLQAYPDWAECACRFDVALVQRNPKFVLQDYIESAFAVS